MATLAEASQEYKPQTTKVVSDLPKFNIHLDLKTFKGVASNGENFSYKYIEVHGYKFRVPTSVIKQINTFMAEIPDLVEVKVIKDGEGMNTTYTVMPITN